MLGVIGDELVDCIGESDHLRGDVIDERCAVDAATVEIFQKGAGRAAIFDDLFKIVALAAHEFERLGLEQIDRRDVDVAVGDHAVAGD